MLHSAINSVLIKRNVGSKPFERRIPYNTVKRDQCHEDVGKIKYRLGKFVPTMQQTYQMNLRRGTTKKIYQRKLNHNRTESGGLNGRCKQELQHLRSDKLDVERDLIHLNRDPVKISSSSSPAISQSSLLYQNKNSSENPKLRLSLITEENSSICIMEKPTSVPRYSSLINRSQISRNHIIPIKERSSINKINSNYQHDRWLRKYSFQQNIAKTSDDRFYLQQHAHSINQQKRLIEQKLKEFLE
ncbi:unnamed protein product [Rotaria sp. Silwood1]|nr:unnamed protein product [Rotaria sp. Silwood1]CAF3392698.1 unnamed protein product [Rotaria sp. Silwood1]